MSAAPTLLTIASVTVRRGRRTLNDESTKNLAASISAIGLQTPITVRPLDGTNGERRYELIAGHHRLEACRLAGLNAIPAIVLDCDDDDAKMWEISENLHRAELSALDRAEHINEWVRLSARISGHGGRKFGRGRPESGVPAAAQHLNLSERTVRRAVAVAGLSPEAKSEARALGLANSQKALTSAASAADPVRALREHTDGGSPSADLSQKIAAHEAAKIISQHVPPEEWTDLADYLRRAGAASIARHLTGDA